MSVKGEMSSSVDRFQVVVDQDAEPIEWDETLAMFLIRYVRSLALAGASTAVRQFEPEAAKGVA